MTAHYPDDLIRAFIAEGGKSCRIGRSMRSGETSTELDNGS